jgi:large subunit ribosomal protein L35
LAEPSGAILIGYAFSLHQGSAGQPVAWRPRLCHNAASRCPAKGCRGGGEVLNQHAQSSNGPADAGFGPTWPAKESQMPKLKTKSGAKKRFKITGTGKVLFAQSGKRHGMIKRTKKQIREHRGTKTLFKTDGDNIKKYWLPNG